MAHTLRSVGNSVGVPAFCNTNRKNPKYLKRANRIARKKGFMSHDHMTIFAWMLQAKKEQMEAAE